MRKLLILLAMAAILSGCSVASENAQPGLKGVREAPPADVYVGRSGVTTDVWRDPRPPGSDRLR
jgi:hypothetical protein